MMRDKSQRKRQLNAAELLHSSIDRLGVYLHVPFCGRICPFCPYNKVQHETDRAQRYFSALSREIDAYVDAVAQPFTSLYIGGGTPSLYLPEIEPLLARLPVEGERAMEVLPEHITKPALSRLKEMGFGFVSIGIQSFDEGMLKHLDRSGDPERYTRAIELAMEHVDLVDIDLIFDATFPDPLVFLRDLEACFRLGVHQVSAYPLMRFSYTHAGTPIRQPHLEHSLMRRAEEIATYYGYERRSLWAFGRPGAPPYASINRDFYIGLGAGAASYTGRWFAINHFSPARYSDAIAAHTLPVARAWRLPSDIAALYWMFWQFYSGSLDADRLYRLFERSQLISGLLRSLHVLGWARLKGRRWVLTPEGRAQYHDIGGWVIAHWIEPLWTDLMREHAGADRPPGLRGPSFSAWLRHRVPLIPSRAQRPMAETLDETLPKPDLFLRPGHMMRGATGRTS